MNIRSASRSLDLARDVRVIFVKLLGSYGENYVL